MTDAADATADTPAEGAVENLLAEPVVDDAAAAEEARRAALTDDERATEDSTKEADAAAAEEARRAALTDDERAAEDAAAKADEGAPEEYAEFAAPEGIELDAEALDAFKAIAKEDNLSQAKAQRYVDAAAALIDKAGKDFADSVLETRKGWIEASRTDKEFGGEALDQNLATARRGLEAIGSPALKAMFDATGLGNHPEIIRALVKVGKMTGEDKIDSGTKPTNAPASLADRLYPNHAKTA